MRIHDAKERQEKGAKAYLKPLMRDGKKLCQFTTPDALAEFMVNWAIRSADDTVLDPCSGNSILLDKGMSRLMELGASASSAAKNVYGIEISKRTIKTAVSNFVPRFGNSLPHFIASDFLMVKPSDLPPISALVCNPPYHRHQGIPDQYKTKISAILDKEFGTRFPRESSLYVHFLVHASEFLAKKGRMVFLIPSQFMDNNYGLATKKFLAERFTISSVILFDETLRVFPNSTSTASIILLENTTPKPQSKTMFAKLKSIPTASQLLELVQGRREHAGARVNAIRQHRLRTEPKWSHFFGDGPIRFDLRLTLRDIAEVKRGIATGANEYFVLNDEELKKTGIEADFARPVLAKTHYAPFLDFTTDDWEALRVKGKKVWLFDCRIPKDQIRGGNSLSYIEEGASKGYDKRYLTRHRNPWYSQERRLRSQILFTCMSNGRPRFIFNRADVVPLNVLHMIYPIATISSNETKLKALLAYLNSSYVRTQLRYFGRTYGGGLLKMEPRDLLALPVLDINRLSRRTASQLAGAFDRLCALNRDTSRDFTTVEVDRILALILPPTSS